MYTLILVISLFGESISVVNIPMSSLELCEKGGAQALKVLRNNTGHTHNNSAAICVESK